MDKSEATELLTFAAAYDQRTIGRADVEAWAMAMTKANVPLDESTREAIVEYYTETPVADTGDTSRRFIQPHHVVSLRRRIRTARARRLPMPCPNPTPGVSEGDEIRAIERAIADGKITTRAELAAYERWGGSLHLAALTAHMPQLAGPDPVDRGPIELPDVFRTVPALERR